jgi:alkanesulfonate monooxygenase SsuD/methylene tetrahydromethanopterin reductase-like flavin-dependent oxidoreductase (luciferase family)
VLTDESMDIMRELWTRPDPVYRSERWNLAGFKFAPKPRQRPAIPLWVGGASRGALRRAATRGDGWHPTGLSPEEFRAGAEEVRKLATAARRDPDALVMSMRVEVEVGGQASSRRAAGRARLRGDDASALREGMRAYQRAGVDHIVLALNSGDMAGITALMADIAHRVMPHLGRPGPER